MGKKQWTIVLRSLWGKYWQIFHRQTDLEDTLLSKHTTSRFPTIINWCFLSGTRRKYADISVFTLTVSKKRKEKKNLQLPTMITQSHLVPGKQIQALHFPRTDFCRRALKRWNASDAAQKSTESLSEVCV